MRSGRAPTRSWSAVRSPPCRIPGRRRPPSSRKSPPRPSSKWGPRHGPPYPPSARAAPAQPWRPSLSRRHRRGPSRPPPRFQAPSEVLARRLARPCGVDQPHGLGEGAADGLHVHLLLGEDHQIADAAGGQEHRPVVGREQGGAERRPPQTLRARLQLAAEGGGERRHGIDLDRAGQLGGDDEAVRRDDEGAAHPVLPLQLRDDVPHVAAPRGAVVLERELEAWSAHETLLVRSTGVSAGVEEGAAAGGPAANPSSCSVADHSRFRSSSPWVGSVARGSASETTRSPSVRVKTASWSSSTMARWSGPRPARPSVAAASCSVRASASETSLASSATGCDAISPPSARPMISARPVPGSRSRSTRGAAVAFAGGGGAASRVRTASNSAVASGNSG